MNEWILINYKIEANKQEKRLKTAHGAHKQLEKKCWHYI